MVNVKTFIKVGRARDNLGTGEHWKEQDTSPTVNLFDIGDTRSVVIIAKINYEN